MVTITFLSRIEGKTITVIGDCDRYQEFVDWFVGGSEDVVRDINLFHDGVLLLDLTYKFYLATGELYDDINIVCCGVAAICGESTKLRRLANVYKN